MADELVAVIDNDENLNDEDSPIINNVNGERRKRPIRTGGLSCQVDLGTGSTKCCVNNCSTNKLSSTRNSQVTFVTFPKDPSRFTEWTRAIERPDLLCYAGKKEATDLLVCSRHFSEDMWVNSNTRLKRLHKNAVPEKYATTDFADDDFDIIEINPPPTLKTPGSRKGGLKLKKVSSLLSDSAFKESLSSSDQQFTVMTATGLNSVTTSPPSTRKWPSIMSRNKQLSSGTTLPASGSTPTERKLLSENAQMKAELDKNMDYILNQKAHYDGLLKKEKEKASSLQAKLTSLETSQRKLWHTYEAQLKAQKVAVENKSEGQQELRAMLKAARKVSDASERELKEAKLKVAELSAHNSELEYALQEASDNRPPTPPPAEPNFIGENFRVFIERYVQTEKQLREKVASLTEALQKAEHPDTQKEFLVELGKRHLSHLQASFLEAMVAENEMTSGAEFRFTELWKALQESSGGSKAVAAVLGALGVVRPPAFLQDTTASSTINALYDELEKTELHAHRGPRTSLISKSLRNDSAKRERLPSPQLWVKRSRAEEGDDDEREEGMASDEEEDLFFSESDEEEEDEKMEILDTESPKPSGATFEFMLGGGDVDTVEEEVIGGSMPMLVPDSLSTQNLGDTPLRGRKSRVITSSDSGVTSSDAKVVYRVLES